MGAVMQTKISKEKYSSMTSAASQHGLTIGAEVCRMLEVFFLRAFTLTFYTNVKIYNIHNKS